MTKLKLWFKDVDQIKTRNFQAEEQAEEIETLLRKSSHLCGIATEEVNKEDNSDLETDLDQKYYELDALADRLSSVSKQLKGN